MKKLFTKLGVGLSLLLPALSVSAQDIITAQMNSDPANYSSTSYLSNIYIDWTGVDLQMDDPTPGTMNLINSSLFDIEVQSSDGATSKVTLGDEKNSITGYGAVYRAPMESGYTDRIVIYLPFNMGFMTPGYTVTVKIAQGAVTSTTGEINPEINLTIYIRDVVSSLYLDWKPLPNQATFNKDNQEVNFSASWSGYTITEVNENPPIHPFITSNESGQIDALDKMTANISENKVEFDFNALNVGSYTLTLPEGVVLFTDNAVNGEASYSFTVTGTAVTLPNYKLTLLPGDEYNWTRGFTLQYPTDNGELCKLKVGDGAENLIVIKAVSEDTDTGDTDDPDVGVVPSEGLPISVTLSEDETTLTVELTENFLFADGEYSITVPADLITVIVSGTECMNTEIAISEINFGSTALTLPDVTTNPAEGTVEDLTSVEITWPATSGNYLLNSTGTGEVTVSFGGQPYTGITTSLVWSSEDAKVAGAEGDILLVEFTEPIENAGEYTITVPAGYLHVTDLEGGSNTNTVVNLAYNVEKDIPEVTPTPADKATVSALTQITLSWDGTEIELANGTATATLTPENGTSATLTGEVKNENGEYSLVFDLSTPYLAAGEYTLEVEADYVTLPDYYNQGNEAIEYTYTVEYNYAEVPEINPEEGPVEAIEAVTFTWTVADGTLAVNEEAGDITVTLDEEVLEDVEFTTEVEDNVLTLTFTEALNAPGEYVITVPEAYLQAVTGVNTAVTTNTVTATYTIEMPEVPEATVTPEEDADLTALTTVTVSWDNEEVAVADDATASVTLTYGGNDPVDVTEVSVSADGTSLVINLGTSAIAPGQYTVTIPAGYVTFPGLYDQTTDEDLTFTFNVEPTALTATVEPADNDDAEEVSSVTFSWTTDAELFANEYMELEDALTITYGGQAYEGAYSTGMSDNTFTVTLGEAQTEPGTYVVSLAEGYLLGLTADAEGVMNATATATYTIGEPEENIEVTDVEPTIDPKDGSLLNTLTTITVDWDLPIETNPFAASATFNGKPVSATIDGTSLIFSVTVTADGIYTLEIPEEFVILTMDGVRYYNSAVTAKYTVESALPTQWLGNPLSIDPADGSTIYNPNRVTITWDLPLYINPENTVQATLGKEVIYGVCNGNSLVFDIEGLEVGNYTLTIPEAYVLGEEVNSGYVLFYYNRALTVSFTVAEEPTTGIAGIEADANGLYRVYNLRGANVMTTDNAANVKSLSKGIYIVNGKKVVIK